MATARIKFTRELATIWSNKSFAQVTAEMETLLQCSDLPELAPLLRFSFAKIRHAKAGSFEQHFADAFNTK